jgi:hypothetical protein
MPRFVLLLHALPDGTSHHDLLLERGEALAAWRLPAPLVRLPPEGAEAERLKDHRTVYLAHEGEVRGGRGTVRRVDEGTYETEAWGADRVRVRVAGRVARGTLVLEGALTGGATWRARFTTGT